MTSPENNKYYAEAENIRQRLMDNEVKPYVKEVFYKLPWVNSVIMLVGQFYDDGALDALHKEFIFTTHLEPETTEEGLYDLLEDMYYPDKRRETGYYGHNDIYEYYGDLNLEQRKTLGLNLQSDYNYEKDWCGDSIRSFSCYCKDYGSQEYDHLLDSYTPYAVFKRTGDSFVTEIIGIKHRPHLDGISTEYEKRNDNNDDEED